MELRTPFERSFPAITDRVDRSLEAVLHHEKPPQVAPGPELVDGLHPMEWLHTKGKDVQRAQRFEHLQRTYGYGAAMNEFMAVEACRGVRRLGGLPSHNLSYQILSGSLETIGLHDIYNRPQDSPIVRPLALASLQSPPPPHPYSPPIPPP